MIVNAFIFFQEFKKENPLKFDNLPVHFGQLEFRESLAKSLLGLDSGVKHSDFNHLVKQSLSGEKQRFTLQFPQWINVLQCVSGSSCNLA
jgi:hypothetical protein